MQPTVPWLDATVYPDVEHPRDWTTIEARIDFTARLCSAWDFGVLPRRETIDEIRQPEWREAVDACRLLTSPAYHLLRSWHGLPPEVFLGDTISYIKNDPELNHV